MFNFFSSCCGAKIDDEPDEIFAAATNQNANQKQSTKNIKIIGAPGVGKTKILETFQIVRGEFVYKQIGSKLDTNTHSFPNPFEFDYKGARFSIEECALDKEFQKETVDGYILVFDLSNQETLLKLRYILNEIMRQNGNTKKPALMLLGNKINNVEQIDAELIDALKNDFNISNHGVNSLQQSEGLVDLLHGFFQECCPGTLLESRNRSGIKVK